VDWPPWEAVVVEIVIVMNQKLQIMIAVVVVGIVVNY
jgi:hypothetical protein